MGAIGIILAVVVGIVLLLLSQEIQSLTTKDQLVTM